MNTYRIQDVPYIGIVITNWAFFFRFVFYVVKLLVIICIQLNKKDGNKKEGNKVSKAGGGGDEERNNYFGAKNHLC